MQETRHRQPCAKKPSQVTRLHWLHAHGRLPSLLSWWTTVMMQSVSGKLCEATSTNTPLQVTTPRQATSPGAFFFFAPAPAPQQVGVAPCPGECRAMLGAEHSTRSGARQ